MEQSIYTLNWSAAIAPEVALIPDADVFEVTHQELSLTAIRSEQPGLLFAVPDILIERVQCVNEQQQRQADPPISKSAALVPIHTPNPSLLLDEDANAYTDETHVAIV